MLHSPWDGLMFSISQVCKVRRWGLKRKKKAKTKKESKIHKLVPQLSLHGTLSSTLSLLSIPNKVKYAGIKNILLTLLVGWCCYKHQLPVPRQQLYKASTGVLYLKSLRHCSSLSQSVQRLLNAIVKDFCFLNSSKHNFYLGPVPRDCLQQH